MYQLRKINPVSFENSTYELTLTREILTEKYQFKNEYSTIQNKIKQKRVDYIMQFGCEPKFILIHPRDAYDLIKDYHMYDRVYFSGDNLVTKYIGITLIKSTDLKEGEIYVTG